MTDKNKPAGSTKHPIAVFIDAVDASQLYGYAWRKKLEFNFFDGSAVYFQYDGGIPEIDSALAGLHERFRARDQHFEVGDSVELRISPAVFIALGLGVQTEEGGIANYDAFTDKITFTIKEVLAPYLYVLSDDTVIRGDELALSDYMDGRPDFPPHP